ETSEEISDEFRFEDFKHVFDQKKPTCASPTALALFISFKCFDENKKIGVADQTKAAFLRYWDEGDSNGRYCGPWRWDNEKNGGFGNPAQSKEVNDMVAAVKARDAAEGSRDHAAAMKKEWMDQIMDWSNRECPQQLVVAVLAGQFPEQRSDVMKHLMMRAWCSTAFTLWTRNFELAKLRRRNYRMDLTTEDEYRLSYDECILDHRKGWMHKLNKSPRLQSHCYNIYPQPDIPSCDMYTHIRVWFTYLATFVYRNNLQPEDFLFPSVSASGILHPGAPISHDTVQKWLNEFVKGSRIQLNGLKLTTHCFRRGGAQHRFMRAPVGQRWALREVRWWGGWADGEDVS
ncbi:hypothetical protein M422DRAFT_81339, partial [Sphaerobolus stellatus SS14]